MRDYALLRIRVQPRASRDSVHVSPEGICRAAVTAPPAENEANEAVRALLAKSLRIPKRDITLESGAKSRDKMLRISGMNTEEVMSRLR
jgi:uncharacterized protein (TIGR00251 family)